MTQTRTLAGTVVSADYRWQAARLCWSLVSLRYRLTEVVLVGPAPAPEEREPYPRETQSVSLLAELWRF